MKKLHIDLENCYGIKKLKADFDFSANGRVFTIYAPNGVMKTSLANTFGDLAKGEQSSDRIWPQKATKRIITDETGAELPKEAVFVIEPYNEAYRSDRLSTLLVNETLRRRYLEVHAIIDEKTELLVDALKPRTGLKSSIKESLAVSITHDRNDFFRALVRIKEEVLEGTDSTLGDVVYSDIFNPKVEAILNDPEFRNSVENYVKKYDELLTRSTFFRKGVFTHNNAADVAKALSANGFFKADHSVYLRVDGEKKEVSTLTELEKAIQSEKDRILTDEKLKNAFEKIDKQLTKNVELKKFRACLEQHPAIVAELSNPERLKQKLWVAYLIKAKEQFEEVLRVYNEGKAKIAEIVEEAGNERTRWAQVIHIFNERFSVPFVVRMDNQVDVILKSVAPVISFDFLDDSDDRDSESVGVEEGVLRQVLSNGEKRALYLLNIIFEVEARRTSGQETLFIVDDIADSFDYKNKYAIVEYLKEVSEDANFSQLIFSHNFDFYRTVSGRLALKRNSRMLASKANGGVELQAEKYQKSPFAHWRQNLDKNDSMLIAAIPFLRNLAEYSGDDPNFDTLTSLLHLKSDTQAITKSTLEGIVKNILKDCSTLQLLPPNKPILELIHDVADILSNDPNEVPQLEDKVVLSMAIRLKAEEFMIRKINDPIFVQAITANQTIALIKRFKNNFPTERDNIQLVEQVNLMTPENIHLNSFMYEPILDLSAGHLKKLYGKVKAMN